MKRHLRKLALAAVLMAALGAFGYFAFMRPQARHGSGSAPAAAVYYCPMHKDYHSDNPGNCPICGMKLVKLEHPGKPDASVISAPSPQPAHAAPGADQNQIFIAPEKQQLIGMRSLEAE